jgi:Arc/MetJ family transcription regulator
MESMDILSGMTKRLVEIPDELLVAAQAALGTATMKDTINRALIRSVCEAEHELDKALQFASTFDTSGHESAWH